MGRTRPEPNCVVKPSNRRWRVSGWTTDGPVLAAVCASLVGSPEPPGDRFRNGVGCVLLNEVVRLGEADQYVVGEGVL